MSRIRTIKPSFWTNAKVLGVSRDARLLFLGLLNEVDDEGRVRYLPVRLLGMIFPADEDVNLEILSGWVNELTKADLITIYSTERHGEVLSVGGFSDHQRINRFTPSELPEETSLTPQESRKRVGKGMEKEGMEEAFSLFWESVPRKTGKAEARKAWMARITQGATPDVLLSAMRRYSEANVETPIKYIKYPASFLALEGPWTEWLEDKPDTYTEMSNRTTSWS